MEKDKSHLGMKGYREGIEEYIFQNPGEIERDKKTLKKQIAEFDKGIMKKISNEYHVKEKDIEVHCIKEERQFLAMANGPELYNSFHFKGNLKDNKEGIILRLKNIKNSNFNKFKVYIEV